MSNIDQMQSAVYESKPARWFATASVLSILYYSVSVVLLHVFDTSVSPLTQGVSYFGVGPYKYLITAAFIVLGLGGLALTMGLYLTVSAEARSLLGLMCLGLWSITTILAGIFPLDAEGSPHTTSGTIHNLAGMNFLLITVAAPLISRRLKHDRRWQGAGQIAMRMALAVIIASVLLFVLMGMLQPLGVGGVAQRVYWLALLVWLSFVSTRLRKVAANDN